MNSMKNKRLRRDTNIQKYVSLSLMNRNSLEWHDYYGITNCALISRSAPLEKIFAWYYQKSIVGEFIVPRVNVAIVILLNVHLSPKYLSYAPRLGNPLTFARVPSFSVCSSQCRDTRLVKVLRIREVLNTICNISMTLCHPL